MKTKSRKTCRIILLSISLLVLPITGIRGDENSFLKETKEIPKLENPMSVEYLKKNLRNSHPRLVLNPSIEKDLRNKVKNDPVVKNMYAAIKLNTENIYEQPLLERKQIGRRLLSVSREMLYRMNMLGMVYRMEKDRKTLNRINDELIAVCNFSDWNPSHFLDVAEMSMAVAIGLDWTGMDLPKSLRKKILNWLQKPLGDLLTGFLMLWLHICQTAFIPKVQPIGTMVPVFR
jgi:hypothetical protein